MSWGYGRSPARLYVLGDARCRAPRNSSSRARTLRAEADHREDLPTISCASSFKALGPSQRLPPPSCPGPDAPTTSSMSTSVPLARCPSLAAPHGPVAQSRTRTRARPQRICSRASATRASTTHHAGPVHTSPAGRRTACSSAKSPRSSAPRGTLDS